MKESSDDAGDGRAEQLLIYLLRRACACRKGRLLEHADSCNEVGSLVDLDAEAFDNALCRRRGCANSPGTKTSLIRVAAARHDVLSAMIVVVPPKSASLSSASLLKYHLTI